MSKSAKFGYGVDERGCAFFTAIVERFGFAFVKMSLVFEKVWVDSPSEADTGFGIEF